MRARRRIILLVTGTAFLVVSSSLGLAQTAHIIRNREFGTLSPPCRINTARKTVALSFDDGPDPAYTSTVLSLLERDGATATFFVTGQHAELYPELIADELATGMEVGNHTWSHPRLLTLDTSQAMAEVSKTNEILFSLGATIHLFRAPYGEATPEQLRKIARSGLVSVHWSIALDHYVDGLGLSPAEAATALLGDIHPGDIILAHDARDGGIGREAAMTTLRLLLPALRERGFQVTTVGDLLAAGGTVPAQPREWFWEHGFTCPST